MKARCLLIYLWLGLLFSGFSAGVNHRRTAQSIRKLPPYLPVGPIPSCNDKVITCGPAPYFGHCVPCSPQFFYCKGPDEPPMFMYCSGGKVFNPDPNFPQCILSTDCPYSLPMTDETTYNPTAISSTTSSIPTTSNDCLDSLICEAKGNFAKCASCQPEYFSCEEVGQPGIVRVCPLDKVFDTNPNHPKCIEEKDCPT